MNATKVAMSAGGVPIGRITLHGIESDLILVARDRVKTRGAVNDVLWGRRCQEPLTIVP